MVRVSLVFSCAARHEHASTSSWLWGSDDRDAYADGPPPTPLAGPPPPRTPCTGTHAAREGMMMSAGGPPSGVPPSAVADAAEIASLREKVTKLRWLLRQADGEIQKLKGDSGVAEGQEG
jgi:hypothetical protein